MTNKTNDKKEQITSKGQLQEETITRKTNEKANENNLILAEAKD